MFKKSFFTVLIGALLLNPATTFAGIFNPNAANQNPFLELQQLFAQGNTNFSFNLKKQNWYSGRCFQPYSNLPEASLLFLLPGDFYRNSSDRGPLFPDSPRMWLLGSDKTNANEFDTVTPKKEKAILKLLRNNPAPPIERFSNSLAARWQTKGSGIALRNANDYLVVQKFSLDNSYVSEYCYYFKKVK